MAAPTQQLPPWFTASISTVTDANGIPLTTSTTLLFLPLTYYGPSIPLGSDWTYGGLTSPASTASSESIPITTSAIPPSTLTSAPSSSATPTPSTSTSESTSTPSVSSSLSSLTSTTASLTSTSSPLTSTLSSSAASTTSAPPLSPTTSSNTGGRPKEIGAILGAVFGGVFIVFLIGLYVCYARRRNRRGPSRFTMVSPIDDFFFVSPDDARAPGEGSPRGSGEEADSFLQRSGGTPQMQQTGAQAAAGPTPRLPPGAAMPQPPRGSMYSSNTGSSTNSGYGTLVETPTISIFPHPPHEQRRGHILPPGDLLRMNNEPPQQQGSADYSPLVPPPRLDPDLLHASAAHVQGRPGRDSHNSQGSFGSKRSSYPIDADEAAAATFLTARRVKVEDLGPRSPPQSPADDTPDSPDFSPTGGSSGWMGSFGLGGLASMGRLSWFKNTESSASRRTSQHAGSRPLSFPSTRARNDNELESGRALLGSEAAESRSSRLWAGSGGLGVGLGPGGERPISSVSARSGTSGTTVYHDANSSIPSTPLLSPLPRAMTPHSGNQSDNNNNARGQSRPPSSGAEYINAEPPAYEDDLYRVESPQSDYPGATALSMNLSPDIDILDMPAPPPISPFSTASTLRDASSTSTRSIPMFPPGLVSLPNIWKDRDISDTGSRFAPAYSTGAGITIDVLEEAPPSPGESWRSLASVAGLGTGSGSPGLMGEGRRATFGLPQLFHQHGRALTSEQGSLDSMRSHLTPGASPRSTGSAPASSWHDLSASFGSGSPRPSPHSTPRSRSNISAGTASLTHSGSLSSDGLRRGRPSPGPLSPALSAFGPGGISPPLSPPPRSPLRGPSHGIERTGTMASMATTTGSTVTDTVVTGTATVTDDGSRPTSPVLRFPSVPWAGGLDRDWTPA